MHLKIQKILSKYGIQSRRKIEKMILNKEIVINNKIVHIGQRFEESKFKNVIIKKKKINIFKKDINDMLILNKKVGQHCTKDKNLLTVFDNLPKIKNSKWINVGRLDVNTSGLLLFCTDGNLAYRLMHPKYNIKRQYKVRVFGILNFNLVKKLKKGIWYNNKLLYFNEVFFLKGSKLNKWFLVTLYQGRNKEIRRLWESIGMVVNKLIRICYANVYLPKSLKEGYFMKLNKKKINEIRNIVKLKNI